MKGAEGGREQIALFLNACFRANNHSDQSEKETAVECEQLKRGSGDNGKKDDCSRSEFFGTFGKQLNLISYLTRRVGSVSGVEMTYKFEIPIRERAMHFHGILWLRSGTDDRRLDYSYGHWLLTMR